MKRSSGILLPIFSLPSNYGIGTLGKQAYKFVDFLKDAKQSYWQILPVGVTSYGDSPYQSFSSNAGNPYFIDLDMLVDDGLLNKKDLKKLKNSIEIDYEYLYLTRYEILHIAYINGINVFKKEFDEYCQNNNWLQDYSLFMALKKYFENKPWYEWDIDIRSRKDDVINSYSELLKEDIEFYKFIQFLFDKQFIKLKEYANVNGIKIIGDLPIYVALDSADVWANTEDFQLDRKTYLPKLVAGVPPDYFSEEGQLWGNPLYDWNHMKQTGYKWWIKRIAGITKYFDVVRIDHFRGFDEYYAVEYGSKTAKEGKWIKGPSLDFVRTITNWFYGTEFIAEDLGIITDSVRKLVLDSGLPGMRVIEFSIGDNEKNCHLPHNYICNCICYTGTHDNMPINGWLKTLNKNELKYIVDYYGLNKDEGYNLGLIRNGMQSIANLFICQLQDYIGLDEKSTINRPGTLGNWKFRLDKKHINKKLSNKIAKITQKYGRFIEN